MSNGNERPGTLLERVAGRREPLALSMFAMAALLVLLTVYWVLKGWEPYRADFITAAIWSALLAILFVLAGLFLVMRDPPPDRRVADIRALIVLVGGVGGLLTALLGFSFAWAWQESVVQWIGDNRLQEARWVLAALAIFVGGVTIMFFSMQSARAEERNSVLLRRLLYGTNAVLTGMLLLFVLTVMNVFVYLKLPDTVITSAGSFKSLSETGKEFLKTVNEDVTVYLIMPENYPVVIPENHPVVIDRQPYTSLYSDCRALLAACHDVNPHIKVVPLLPALDDDRIKELLKRFKLTQEDQQTYGMLIAYGTSDTLSAFIPWHDLFKSTPPGAIVFQGENKLLTEINFLSGGGKRPVIYFTQSNLEPSISAPEGSDPNARSAKELVDYLRERKFDVKPLRLEPGAKPDVSDAEIIVIAAPQRPFSDEQVAFLRQYMAAQGRKPGGKLVACLPAFPDVEGRVSHTGLERFLLDFGVRVADNQRLFTFPMSAEPESLPAGIILAGYAPGMRFDHILRSLLPVGQGLLLDNVRPVSIQQPLAMDKMAGFDLFASQRFPTYRDSKYASDARALLLQIRREAEENRNRALQEIQFSPRPTPVAAYVAEAVGEGQETKERPRLLVLGTDSFITSSKQQNIIPYSEYVSLMGRMLEIMREQPQSMGIEPQALGTFTMPKNTSAVGVLFLPIGIVLLGIVALGGGIWIARRT